MKKNFLMWSFAMALLTGTLCTSCDETEGAVAPEETQSVQKGIAITYLHVTDQIMKNRDVIRGENFWEMASTLLSQVFLKPTIKFIPLLFLWD